METVVFSASGMEFQEAKRAGLDAPAKPEFWRNLRPLTENRFFLTFFGLIFLAAGLVIIFMQGGETSGPLVSLIGEGPSKLIFAAMCFFAAITIIHAAWSMPDPQKHGYLFFDKLTLKKHDDFFYMLEMHNTQANFSMKYPIISEKNPIFQAGILNTGSSYSAEFAFLEERNGVLLVVSKAEAISETNIRLVVFNASKYKFARAPLAIMALDAGEAEKIEAALLQLPETAYGRTTELKKKSIMINKPKTLEELQGTASKEYVNSILTETREESSEDKTNPP